MIIAQTVFQGIETAVDFAALMLLIIMIAVCVISSRTYQAVKALQEIQKLQQRSLDQQRENAKALQWVVDQSKQ